jgi:putative ABC transport system permease protein
MAIIFKFALKSIREKKFRTFLIIFSIMMSSALFFASFSMSGTVEQMVVERIKKSTGSAEIMIYPGPKSPSPYVNDRAAMKIKDQADYIIEMIQGGALYKISETEDLNVNLNGYEYDELQLMNPITFKEESNVEPFSGRKIIINSNMAEKYKLGLNSSLELKIAGLKQRFTIVGIANSTGLFTEDGRTTTAVIPKETLENLYNMKGQATTVYIKPKDMSQKQSLMEQLEKLYKRDKTAEVIPMEDIRRQSSTFTIPFMMMVVLVMSISIFIIYTSFKVITTEMLPVIGTFRSIGATRKMTDFVLIIQSIVYGIIGGALGCALGVGVLYVMARTLLGPAGIASGFEVNMNISAFNFILSFGVALILAIFSSLVPIVKVSKIPVKEIVLNQIEKTNKKKHWKPIVGLVMAILVLIIPRFVPRNLAMMVNALCMVLSGVAVSFLTPELTKGFARFFEKAYLYIFGNEGVLAAQNLRENKNMLNNISLLAMGISAILMINTVSYSVFEEVANAYKDMNYDIEVSIGGADRQILSSIGRIEGVQDAYGGYSTYNIEVGNGNDRIMMLAGVDSSKFNSYYDIGVLGNPDEEIKELDAGRNVIITTALKYKLGLDIGDYITFNTKTGKRDYKITGLCETITYNGQAAFISDKYFRKDMEARYYTDILVKSESDIAQTVAHIKERFRDRGIRLITVAEMEKANNDSNAALFSIFKGFSVMTMVIGIFGILNNFAISFMERKRVLAVLRSVGMSKRQVIKMIMIEALTGGFIGGAVGIIMGVMMISIIPYLLKTIDLPIDMTYDPVLLINGLLGGIIVSLIASISPALKSSKLNIIEAIKYE